VGHDSQAQQHPPGVDRSISARVGAFALHAQFDSRHLTAAARRAFLTRFEQDVDPDGLLPEEERIRRAESARRAYFTQLALKSAKARSTKGNVKGRVRSGKRTLREPGQTTA